MASRAWWVLAASAVLVGSLAPFACQVYDESLLEPASTEVPKDQWGSGVGWWSTKTKDGCISAGIPTADQRPQSSGGDDIPPVFFAVSSMALGSLDRNQEPSKDAWQDLGFDMDGLCSASPGCETAQFELPCKSIGASPPDGRFCRDNSFGKLENEAVQLQGIGKEFGLNNDGFNCALCRGDYNFLIRISEWNGTDNDSNVRIDLYPSPGLTTKPSWSCDLSSPEGTWKKNSCWTKADEWQAQDTGVVGSDPQTGSATLNDPSAYVRDGYIVGQLPADALFWFPGESAARAYPLTLQNGVFAGRLEKKGDEWVVEDGTIAGAAKVTDMIDGFELLGVCAGHPLYSSITFFVNGGADSLASGAVSPEATCDAVSVGIGFRAREATVSKQTVAAKPLPGCPTGGTGGADAGADGSAGSGGSAGTGGAASGGASSGGTGGSGGSPADAGSD
ncbi:MAG: hypothetical protein R3B13_41480 [Polyangiaceae bacterium]